MTKVQANYLLKKIYAALRDENVRFKLSRKIGNIFGELTCDGTATVITLNALKKGARGGFFSTLIHECLHLISAACEKDIELAEEEMFKAITDRQLENLLKRISHKIS